MTAIYNPFLAFSGIGFVQLHPLGHSALVAYRVVKCGYVRVRGLDASRLPRSLCRPDFVGRKCYLLGPAVVR